MKGRWHYGTVVRDGELESFHLRPELPEMRPIPIRQVGDQAQKAIQKHGAKIAKYPGSEYPGFGRLVDK